MSDRIIAALIIGVSAIVSAAMWGGRYTASPVQQGGVYVIDRFVGNALFCTPRECRPIEWFGTSHIEAELNKAYDDAAQAKKSR